MRNPNQLELNLFSDDHSECQRNSDRESARRLQRSQVLTYANAIERGHTAWADLAPPTTQAIQEVLTELQRAPETWGQHYRGTLAAVLDRRLGVQDKNRTMIQLSSLGVRFYIGGDCI